MPPKPPKPPPPPTPLEVATEALELAVARAHWLIAEGSPMQAIAELLLAQGEVQLAELRAAEED